MNGPAYIKGYAAEIYKHKTGVLALCKCSSAAQEKAWLEGQFDAISDLISELIGPDEMFDVSISTSSTGMTIDFTEIQKLLINK